MAQTELFAELIVTGIPASVQGSSKKREDWKSKVGRAAVAAVGEASPLAVSGLRVVIIYFYEDETSIDVDNIIKVTVDGLIGVAFVDDAQVDEVVCRKVRMNELKLETGSRELLAALGNGQDFVSIRVEHNLQEGELP